MRILSLKELMQVVQPGVCVCVWGGSLSLKEPMSKWSTQAGVCMCTHICTCALTPVYVLVGGGGWLQSPGS